MYSSPLITAKILGQISTGDLHKIWYTGRADVTDSEYGSRFELFPLEALLQEWNVFEILPIQVNGKHRLFSNQPSLDATVGWELSLHGLDRSDMHVFYTIITCKQFTLLYRLDRSLNNLRTMESSPLVGQFGWIGHRGSTFVALRGELSMVFCLLGGGRDMSTFPQCCHCMGGFPPVWLLYLLDWLATPLQVWHLCPCSQTQTTPGPPSWIEIIHLVSTAPALYVFRLFGQS